MKDNNPGTIHCPELNKEIKEIDCYETWQGIENIMDEYYDYKTAMKICDNCEARKSKSDEIYG